MEENGLDNIHEELGTPGAGQAVTQAVSYVGLKDILLEVSPTNFVSIVAREVTTAVIASLEIELI